jgi:hypothetical protein
MGSLQVVDKDVKNDRNFHIHRDPDHQRDSAGAERDFDRIDLDIHCDSMLSRLVYLKAGSWIDTSRAGSENVLA